MVDTRRLHPRQAPRPSHALTPISLPYQLRHAHPSGSAWRTHFISLSRRGTSAGGVPQPEGCLSRSLPRQPCSPIRTVAACRDRCLGRFAPRQQETTQRRKGAEACRRVSRARSSLRLCAFAWDSPRWIRRETQSRSDCTIHSVGVRSLSSMTADEV